MTESTLKTHLATALRAGLQNAVVFRHEDMFQAGIPDISVTWHRCTTWLEVKYAHPRIGGKKLQQMRAMQLETEGRCWYVVYVEKRGVKLTQIVRPSEIDTNLDIPDERTTTGFNHDFVVEFIRRRYDYFRS